MTKFKKTAKCPTCCPTGGAEFKKEVAPAGGWQWRCVNCYEVVPCRVVNPVPKVTPSQQRIIDKVKGMGWVVKSQEMIGRKVFVVFEHPTRNLLLGNSTFGAIGPNGSFSFDWSPPFVKSTKLTDRIGLEVYLK